MSQRLTVESVQQSVSSSVGRSAASVSLAALAILLRLSTESTLVTINRKLGHFARYIEESCVHLAVFCSGEGAAVVLEFNNRCGSLTGHVVDGVLVSEPV